MMSNLRWSLRGIRTEKAGPGRGGPRRGVGLEVLALEDRRLLSMVIPVTSNADSGPGTLRAAVDTANSSTEPVEIDFHLNQGGATAIKLISGPIRLSNLSEPVTIDGPGSGLLAVSGSGLSGIFEIGRGVEATISGCLLVNGSSSFGGAISNLGDLTVLDCVFLNNTAPPLSANNVSGPGVGGAIANYNGTLSLTDCTLSGNSANFGGAIFDQDENSSSSVSLTDCTLSGNSAVLYQTPFGNQGPVGGGLESENIYGKTSISLTGCTISGNTAGGEGTFGYGGGIADGAFFGSQTSLTITDCTLSGNSTTGLGGAVDNFYGTMTIEGCTVSGNSAGAGGGGVAASGTNMLTNCTVSGNTAGTGGGIQAYGAGPLSLVACTISGNSATGTAGASGGGLFGATYQGNTPTANLTDTIVAGNQGPGAQASDIGGDPFQVTGSYNLIGTGGSGGLTASAHNLLDVANPGLKPLGEYGGPTQTMALQPDSPAIHDGIAVPGVTTDQRGFSLDNPVDIGAFQSQPATTVVDDAIDALGSPPADGGGLSDRRAAALVFSTVVDNSASADASGQPLMMIGTKVEGHRGGNITGRMIRL